MLSKACEYNGRSAARKWTNIRKEEKNEEVKKSDDPTMYSMIKYAFDLAFDWHWCRYDTIKVCDLTCDHPIYLPMNRLFKLQKGTRTIQNEKKERQKNQFHSIEMLAHRTQLRLSNWSQKKR